LHITKRKARIKITPELHSALFKTPNRPDAKAVVLIVVVLVAIVEVLVPCVVSIVLRRTPIVVVSKTANPVIVKMF